MTAHVHPDDETIGRFVLGRLDRSTMATVETHLRDCSRCGQVAMGVPDDRLVSLLRGSAPCTEKETSLTRTSGLEPARAVEPIVAPSSAKGRRGTGMIVSLVCMAVFAGGSAPGCSPSVQEPDRSPEAVAKARATIKNKFDGQAKKVGKTSR